MQARSNRALVAIRRFMIDREDSHGACRDQGRCGTPYSILEAVRIADILPENCHGALEETHDLSQGLLLKGCLWLRATTGLEQCKIAGQRSIVLRFLDLPSVAQSSDVIHSAKARTARRCRLARGKTR